MDFDKLRVDPKTGELIGTKDGKEEKIKIASTKKKAEGKPGTEKKPRKVSMKRYLMYINGIPVYESSHYHSPGRPRP
jgi:hypothetical protein